MITSGHLTLDTLESQEYRFYKLRKNNLMDRIVLALEMFDKQKLPFGNFESISQRHHYTRVHSLGGVLRAVTVQANYSDRSCIVAWPA